MNGWGRRPRSVYAYDVIDMRGQAASVKIGYVGKSSSRLIFRDTQHRNGQLWAWAIVGEIRPIWQGDCGRISLWVREVYWIHKLKPMFNVEHNKGNRDRVPPWQAKALYERRDSGYRPSRC